MDSSGSRRGHSYWAVGNSTICLGSSTNVTFHLCMFVFIYVELMTSAAHTIKRRITV